MKQSSDKTMQDPRTNKNDEEIIPSRDTSTNAHSFHLPHWIVILLLLFVPPVGWWHMWKNHRYHSWFPYVLWLNAAVTLGFAAYILIHFFPLLTKLFDTTTYIFATHIGLLLLSLFEIAFGFYLIEKCRNEMILRRRTLAIVITFLFLNTIALPISEFVINAVIQERIKDLVPTTTQSSDLSTTWRTFTNKEGAYSLKYPATYKLLENKQYSVDGELTETPDTIEIISPPLPKTDAIFTMRILFITDDGDLSLGELTDKYSWCTEITSSKGKHIVVNQKEALLFEDTPCGPYGATSVYLNNGNTLYQMTIESHERYKEIKPYVDQILSTFKFTDSAQ